MGVSVYQTGDDDIPRGVNLHISGAPYPPPHLSDNAILDHNVPIDHLASSILGNDPGILD